MTEPIVHGNRFANTFLNITNVANAIPDEVLIDKTNGNLYYKLPDGTVVDILKNNGVDTINAELVRLNQAIIDSLVEAKAYTDNKVIASSTEPTNQKVGSIFFEIEPTV